MISSEERALLKSTQQRVRLYPAIFGTYQLLTRTKKKDAEEEIRYSINQWEPVINAGPHRMAFVGETVTFDAIDSYMIDFDNNGDNNRSQGYGRGEGIPNLDWKITPKNSNNVLWSQNNRSWNEAQSWTPTEAGLYELKVCLPGDTRNQWTAKRWIRVYNNRRAIPWSVTGVSSLSGTWGEGWSMGLTIQNQDIMLSDVGVNDYQVVGLYAEEEWWDGSKWIVRPIGSVRQDPRLVMIGIVKEGSVDVAYDNKTVSFQVESVSGVMSRSQVHKCAIWNGKGPDSNGDPGVEGKAKSRDHGKKRNGVDTWGSVLRGFKRVSVSDFALWLLQFKTNLLEYHDFFCCWPDDMADLESIAGEEGAVLSNLQTIAANDWMITGSDHGNAILFAPDRQVTRDTHWDQNWPVRMVFTDEMALNVAVQDNLEKQVKYVQLIATRTTDAGTTDFGSDPASKKEARRQKRKARKKAKREQIKASHPNNINNAQNDPGTWFVKTDLLHDNTRVIETRADKVYDFMNLTWTASISMGANRAIRPGDFVRIDIENTSNIWTDKPKRNPERKAAGEVQRRDKLFLVKSYQAEIDPAAGSWKTSVSLEEVID